MSTETTYLNPTGHTDAFRLSAQENLLEPYSMNWIKEHIRPGSKVMDVGCGHGALTISLAKHVGQEGEVIAVDSSVEQLAIAQKNAQDQGITNIRFIKINVYELAILNEQCDAVHCRWLLAHCKDPMAAIASMASQLKTNGILLCEEPGGDEYDCEPVRPLAFRLWLTAVKIQHWIAGTDRSVALRLIAELPAAQHMSVTAENPPIVSRTPLHKSRFRAGIEPLVQRSNSIIMRYLLNWWINALRALENDEQCVITQRSFYQISAKKTYV